MYIDECNVHTLFKGEACSDACLIRTKLDKRFEVGHIIYEYDNSPSAVGLHTHYHGYWIKTYRNHLVVLPTEDWPLQCKYVQL